MMPKMSKMSKTFLYISRGKEKKWSKCRIDIKERLSRLLPQNG